MLKLTRNPSLGRYMALSDLSTKARSDDFLGMDQSTQTRVVNEVLALMKDNNGEVKNMTVKT